MGHTALYRKYRPQRFNQVAGQSDVTDILKNAVINGRVSHAMLFCGTRGTGKTSTARILAKALNCLNPQEGEPCNECENCRTIAGGNFLDVIEIDAASNRRLDETRELLESVPFAPLNSKYKIYIIDEVHMLIRESFDTLLKTLEEPPGHAVFILATTEPSKVPLTILSRCQRFDFKPINDEIIAEALLNITRSEGIEDNTESLNLIAEKARGSMRDAVTLLDQASDGTEIISPAELNRLTGTVPYSFWPDFFNNIANNNISAVFNAINDINRDGKDMNRFFRDFRTIAGDILTSTPKNNNYGNILGKCRNIFTPEQILEIITVCGEGENLFRYAPNPTDTTRFLMAKILRNIHRKYEETIPDPSVKHQVKTSASVTEIKTQETDPVIAAAQNTEPDLKSTDNSGYSLDSSHESEINPEIRSRILKELLSLNRQSYTWLSKGKLEEVNSDNIIFSFTEDEENAYLKVLEQKHKDYIKEAITNTIGKELAFKAVLKTSETLQQSLF